MRASTSISAGIGQGTLGETAKGLGWHMASGLRIMLLCYEWSTG